jgi:DNA-binding response OmpR family regulator
LLAVVPIPGTETSLAIVGYAITTPAASSPPRPAGPRIRRSQGSGLRLDHGQRRVWTDGREIELTFRQFELLAFLSARPATVFTRADLIEQVWHRTIGRDSQAIARDSRTVDVHVSRVRHKLGPRYGQCLVTEYRVGYQFRPLAP